MDKNIAKLPKESRKSGLFHGYILLVISFFIIAFSIGTVLNFGIFFKPMLNEFGWTREATSGPYSVSMILTGLTGVAAGKVSDRFGPRGMVTLAGIFLGLGILLMSRISSLWQLYLFYGVLAGIGGGCVYVPIAAMMTRWFAMRRGLILGITMSGIGIGVAILPPIATRLMEAYGWRISLLIIGVLALVLIVCLAQFLRNAPESITPLGSNNNVKVNLSSTGRESSFREALRTKQFWFLCIAWALNSFFFQVGMVHIVPYATDLGMSAIAAATILTVIGLLGAMGRVSLGFAGDRFGNRATLIACSMLVAAVYLGLFASRTVWMLYLFAVVFGFFGSVLNLLTPMVAEFFGLKALGTIAGAVMTAIGIGGAVGPVVAGRIFDTNGTYNPAFILCGTLAIITGITLWALKPNLFKRRTEYN